MTEKENDVAKIQSFYVDRNRLKFRNGWWLYPKIAKMLQKQETPYFFLILTFRLRDKHESYVRQRLTS